jgi:hypothetical protein
VTRGRRMMRRETKRRDQKVREGEKDREAVYRERLRRMYRRIAVKFWRIVE